MDTATHADDDPVNGNRRAPDTPRRRARSTSRCCTDGQDVGQTVDVDYFMPRLPPESRQIAGGDLVIKALKGEAALRRQVGDRRRANSTVCDECPRTAREKKLRVKRMATSSEHDGVAC